MTHEHTYETASAFAGQRHLSFLEPMPIANIKEAISNLVLELTRALEVQGCTIIGHIKGRVDAGSSGSLFFNTTQFAVAPRFRGELQEPVLRAELAINIIVYGVTEAQIDRAFENSLRLILVVP
ncbi:MAG: hypothetical protein HOC23_02210 [Halieaceae bacterium]|nr:hypothetical protein [Halieaceae bacterium]